MCSAKLYKFFRGLVNWLILFILEIEILRKFDVFWNFEFGDFNIIMLRDVRIYWVEL